MGVKSELQALEARSLDQERCRELAGNLEGFLDRLNESAESLDVKDRQRILRLLVKEILVGPDALTIKHSIPTSGTSWDPDVPSYVLCGRSHVTPFACPLQ